MLFLLLEGAVQSIIVCIYCICLFESFLNSFFFHKYQNIVTRTDNSIASAFFIIYRITLGPLTPVSSKWLKEMQITPPSPGSHLWVLYCLLYAKCFFSSHSAVKQLYLGGSQLNIPSIGSLF